MAKTIEQIQAMITGKADAREVINEIADYLQANPPGEDGGGGLGYLVATAQLDNEQIKALPSTAVKIIDAPGTGKMVVPLFGHAILDASAGSYDDIIGASWAIQTQTGSIYFSSIAVSQQMLSDSSRKFINFLFPFSEVGDGDFAGEVTTSSSGIVDSAENQGLYIKDDWNGISNYTGGNAANTLTVTIYYILVDV